MKVGIITYHRVRNYGSVLQSYALMKYLQNQGHDVYIINYIPDAHSTKTEFLGAPDGIMLKKMAYVIMSFPLRLRVYRIYKNFRNSYLRLTDAQYKNMQDFQDNPLDMDIYVTGSDQVWNSRYNYCGKENGYHYYLDFTADEEKRVAYAASFGEESLQNDNDPIIGALINRYASLSVRERSGIKKLQNLGRNDAVQVLDPTFLLGKDDWAELFGRSPIKDKYLLIYEPQRRKADKFEHWAEKIASSKGLQIVKIHKEYTKPSWVDKALYPSVNDFLSLFAHAEFVLTNSFHGIAFSLNFNKQFACIPANSANNRIDEILEMVGLKWRMLTSEEQLVTILELDIDYSNVNEEISRQRVLSRQFLDNAIRG